VPVTLADLISANPYPYTLADNKDLKHIWALASVNAAAIAEPWDAERKRFFIDALLVLAGAVCTPEKGYEADGGFGLLLSDIKRLREQRNVLRNALGGLIGACPQWMKNGPDVPSAMTRANEAMEAT
jgi:hypothetical protein